MFVQSEHQVIGRIGNKTQNIENLHQCCLSLIPKDPEASSSSCNWERTKIKDVWIKDFLELFILYHHFIFIVMSCSVICVYERNMIFPLDRIKTIASKQESF